MPFHKIKIMFFSSAFPSEWTVKVFLDNFYFSNCWSKDGKINETFVLFNLLAGHYSPCL